MKIDNIFALMFALVLASSLTSVTCFPPARPPSGPPDGTIPALPAIQQDNNQKCQKHYNSTDYVFEPVQGVCVRCTVCLDSTEPYCRDCKRCSLNPCLNGQCVDLPNSYRCECRPGYTGSKCDTDINECSSNPCLNGQCVDLLNNYRCECRPGYTGSNCDIDINECSSNPCLNGQCVDLLNNYRCECRPGYTGSNCDTEWLLALWIIALIIIIVIIITCISHVKRNQKRKADTPPAVIAPATPQEKMICLDDIGNENKDSGLPKPHVQDTQAVPQHHPMDPNSLSSFDDSSTTGSRDSYAESSL